MSATNTSVNVKNTGASITAGIGEGIKKFSIYGASAAFVASLLWFSIRTSQFAGDVDNWQSLKPKIAEIMMASIMGIVSIVVVAWLYFSQDVKLSITFATIVSLVAVVLAYTALGVAVITR